MTTDANIIELNRSHAHSAMFPAVAQVEAYWHGLCQSSPLPHRSDIDPRGLEAALEYTFVLERIAPGIFRFRIAGHHLADLMGLDVSGMPISAMFDVAARTEIGRIIEEVCTEPCIKEVFINGGRSMGRGALSGKMLLAPLLDEAGQVTRILGCLQTNGVIGRQPRRFAISDVQNKDLPRQPAIYSQPNRPQGQRACAEVPATFDYPTTKPTPEKTERPALQLVVNNA